MILEYIIRQSFKKKKPVKKKQTRIHIKKFPTRATVHIAPRSSAPAAQLSDNIFTDIMAATRPGAKKMQFPFQDIPPIETVVSLDSNTRSVLRFITITTAGAIVVSAIIKRSK